MNAEFEVVIGLEVHIRMNHGERLFSNGLSTEASPTPNSQTEPISLGLPGTLPILNTQTILSGIRLGVALEAKIADQILFERKHYNHPGLTKGYQLTQHDFPLCEQGRLRITIGKATRSIGIAKLHIEEDTARVLHENESKQALIDFNHSGVPLLKVVTQPDLRNPEEVVVFLKRLRQLVRFLNLSTVNIENGEMRCDANISLRPYGELKFGSRIEIKDLHSFRSIQAALEYEVARQYSLLRNGKKISIEARFFDEKNSVTKSIREKNLSQEYLYMPEPDLPAVIIPRSTVEMIRSTLPLLPEYYEKLLSEEYRLEEEKIAFLTRDPEIVEYFLKLQEEDIPVEIAYHWLSSEVFPRMSLNKTTQSKPPVEAKRLSLLLKMLIIGEISGRTAKYIYSRMQSSNEEPEAIVQKEKLSVVRNIGIIQQYVREAFANFPSQLSELRSGKTQLESFFVGRIMHASSGRLDPSLLKEQIRLLCREI